MVHEYFDASLGISRPGSVQRDHHRRPSDSAERPALAIPHFTLTSPRPPASQATPAQKQAWASFLAGAVHNGLDPTLVTQWPTILADATGSPVLPSLASMPLGDYVNLRLPVILTGLETTTHAPYLAGWHLRIEPELGRLPLRLITTALITAAVLGWIADGCSRSTIKNTLAMLSRIFEQAIADGILEHNPAHIAGRQREFQPVEDELRDPYSLALHGWDALTKLADALVAASYNRYRGWGDVVVHSVCTATRIGKVSGVRARDVDTEKWLLTCRRQTPPLPAAWSTSTPRVGSPVPPRSSNQCARSSSGGSEQRDATRTSSRSRKLEAGQALTHHLEELQRRDRITRRW
ncbi:hypothetical protein ACFC1T_12555 [Kitasatospora sp. NPDC056076]|uniref:hypothetical protein n=1 Tax=Kitasatospora sp. NPDC056076 TaxID=3345703 RepID=UPI0035D5E6DD